MLIGLGGGAASSVASGQSSEAMDFASVQRDNPEMERRCQEVIDRCVALGEGNPIRFMHDVGAGGLSNAIPELLHDSGVGGVIDLAKVPSVDPSLSPMQLWSNESQERYVLGVAPERLAEFEALCPRERCPFAVVGTATAEQRLLVGSAPVRRSAPEAAIDMPMDLLFGKAPKMHRDTEHPAAARWPKLDTSAINLHEAGLRVLSHPTVAAKNFLVTIGDRSVGGLSSRDQMVGPWQLPLADCAISLTDFLGFSGEAMAMGERTPLALIDAAASARMAVGEAITNLAAAPVGLLVRGQVVRQLDGRRLAPRRRRLAVRRGQGDRAGALPGPGYQHSRRQGLAVHAGAVGAQRRAAEIDLAGVPDRHRLRPRRRCPPAADAGDGSRSGFASCG